MSGHAERKTRVWDDPRNAELVAQFCQDFTDSMRHFDFTKHEAIELLKVILKE